MSNSKTHNELEFFKEGLDAGTQGKSLPDPWYEIIFTPEPSEKQAREEGYKQGLVISKLK